MSFPRGIQEFLTNSFRRASETLQLQVEQINEQIESGDFDNVADNSRNNNNIRLQDSNIGSNLIRQGAEGGLEVQIEGLDDEEEGEGGGQGQGGIDDNDDEPRISRFLRSISQASRSTNRGVGTVNGESADGGGNGRGESAATNAANYRLNTTNIDFRALLVWMEQQGVFALLMVFILVYRNLSVLVVLSWVILSLMEINKGLKKQIAKRERSRQHKLLSLLMALTLYIGLVILCSRGLGYDLRNVALLVPRRNLGVWESIIQQLFADVILVSISIALKIVVVLRFRGMVNRSTSFRRQGHWLTAIEHGMQLYRSVIPTAVWFDYFSHCGMGQLLQAILQGAYLGMKSSVWAGRLYLTGTSVLYCFHRMPFGQRIESKEEIMEAGDQCPICQERLSQTGMFPTKLECGHIFCEDCIMEWLERDRTCPMCRSNIKPPGLKSFGDGQTTILPQIF
eukprot:TRINITY_DN18836_c0_g1_i1.p1 TRINITY_DN18836_c0_g1~~TRINITY_DN18836_c0_g1_i1.p1  ORF type:complete len:453 (+),score=43.61 TRINITY_DN18836_c0_g1_i1:188-1546(+)